MTWTVCPQANVVARTDGRPERVTRGMKPIPVELGAGPFPRGRALELGVTPRMLRGRRFERVHHDVYRVASGPMTYVQLVEAARLALPASARLTGMSRLRELGLDYGPPLPIRFVVEGDHHLAIPGVFLHRTKALAPTDEVGVCVEAAFISYCSLARMIDAIKVGSWLCAEGHMDRVKLCLLADAHHWRAGALETLYVVDHLYDDAWSLKESETAAVLTFAGLPAPELNVRLDVPGRTVIGDLLYRDQRLVVEYEGTHHQDTRARYVKDIDRYAAMRDAGYAYLQVTDERLARPRQMVALVHRALVRGGYDGPDPAFGEPWRTLFARLKHLVGPRDPGQR